MAETLDELQKTLTNLKQLALYLPFICGILTLAGLGCSVWVNVRKDNIEGKIADLKFIQSIKPFFYLKLENLNESNNQFFISYNFYAQGTSAVLPTSGRILEYRDHSTIANSIGNVFETNRNYFPGDNYYWPSYNEQRQITIPRTIEIIYNTSNVIYHQYYKIKIVDRKIVTATKVFQEGKVIYESIDPSFIITDEYEKLGLSGKIKNMKKDFS